MSPLQTSTKTVSISFFRNSSIFSSIHPSILPFIHPSSYSSIHSSTHPSILPLIHPFSHSSIYLSTHLSLLSFVYPFSHSSIHPSIHFLLRPLISTLSFIHLPIFLPSYHSYTHPFILPPINPSFHRFLHTFTQPSILTLLHSSNLLDIYPPFQSSSSHLPLHPTTQLPIPSFIALKPPLYSHLTNHFPLTQPTSFNFFSQPSSTTVWERLRDT